MTTYDVVVRARHRKSVLPHPTRGESNRFWWPRRLNLRILARHSAGADPLGADFDYAAAFDTLDLAAVRHDVERILTTSQEWWPADFGHYGPFMVRMAWHAAGSYRIADGRGGARAGMLRFAPLNSWPDNRGLDKARRLLWPVKRRYGRALSWADLMIFAGTVALESMGFTTFGFAGGREDVWESDGEAYWGPERTWLADERHTSVRDLQHPLAASQMGLVYVNPEGPNRVPDPYLAGREMRVTHRRMGLDDEETVALIVGGHTFGKTHGAAPETHLGPEPEGARLEDQGLGWRNGFGTGAGADAITSGLEGTWTPTPTTWDNSFLSTLYDYEWDAVLSPAGLWQWIPSDGAGAGTVPDAHVPSRTHAPTVLTTDLALRFDPVYAPISQRYREHPDLLADAFARAWFKLTHRDLGPIRCYRGPLVPAETLIWQDPVPAVDHELVGAADIAELKRRILDSGLSVSQLVSTAWASASTFRSSDRRGGANGARIRLEPQRRWEVNDPDTLAHVLAVLEGIRSSFRESVPHARESVPHARELRPQHATRGHHSPTRGPDSPTRGHDSPTRGHHSPTRGGIMISLADLIVLAGCAAVERAAADAGVPVDVPFHPGRTDASQEQTDVASFDALEPAADGFRNWSRTAGPTEHLLVDRAALLTLSAPEMTVLVGGLRVLGAGRSPLGVLTDRPGVLTTDFFVNLLDMGTAWSPGPGATYEGRDRASGELRWTASRVDLVFGSNSELRALVEVYAADDAREKFVHDFVAAWVKVMSLDRFER